MNEPPTNAAVARTDTREKPLEFVPFGGTDKITLTVKIVKNLLCKPTKSGAMCSDADALRFMMLCQARRLNPFEGDAFLVGYDGKYGPEFSLITAHQAFLKRAESSPDYDGMESGLIIRQVSPVEGDEQNPVNEIQGDFHLPDQQVLGGWAKVFHKKRSHPTYRRLRLERFNKGFAEWQKDPAGMICKCAEADALRSTFPTLVGGLYMDGEVINVSTSVQAETLGNLPAIEAPKLTPVQPGPPEPEHMPDGEKPKVPFKTKDAPQVELAKLVESAGFNINHFQEWGRQTGVVPNADTFPDFDSMSTELCQRMLRAKVGLLKGLEAVAKGQVEKGS